MADKNELNKQYELSEPENIELVTLSDIDSHTQHSPHHLNDFNSLQVDFTILENDKSRLHFQKQPDISDMSNCSRENTTLENNKSGLHFPTQGYTIEQAIAESATQHHKTEESTSQDTHSSISAQQETEQCTCKSTSSFNASNYLPPMELNNSHHSNSSISILSESRTDSDSLTNNTSGSHINNENSLSSECINDFTGGVHLELHDIELDPNLSSSFITTPTKNFDKARNDSCDKIIKIEEDLAIRDSEIPDKFKKAYCDAVIIYCEKDERDALLFRDVIEKFVTLEDGNKPRICTVYGDGYPQWGQSRFKQWEDAINGSTYMFLFITENFIHDTWAGLQFDECLQASIDEPDKRWCAVPVHSVNKNNCKFIVPWGIRCLKGLYIDQMFKRGKKLQEIDLSEINMGNLSPFFIKGMTELLNSKLHIKTHRIAAQEDTLTLWKEEEIDRRRIKLIQHGYDNEIRAAKADKRKLLREEVMLTNQQEALNQVQGMTTLDDSEPQESVVRTFQDHSLPNTAPCCVINISNSTGISIGPKNTQIVGQTSHGDPQSQVCDSGDENSDLIVIERTHGQDINQEKPTQTTGQFEHDHATASDATFVKSVE